METTQEISILDKKLLNLVNLPNDYKDLLKESGFDSVQKDYFVISEQAIEDLLKNNIIKLNPQTKTIIDDNVGFFGTKKIKKEATLSISNRTIVVSKKTQQENCNFIKYYREYTYNANGYYNYFSRQLNWIETPINMYVGAPPKHVLESVIKAKKEFDEIVVVTLSDIRVIDPLVVGIKKNNKNRFLIDWWDHDIDPAELVK